MKKSIILIGVLMVLAVLFLGCSSFQPHKHQPGTGQAIYDQAAERDVVGEIIDGLQVANAASAPFNPWAAGIGGILTILSIGYGALKRKDAIDAGNGLTEKQRQFAELVKGIQNILDEETVDTAKPMKTQLANTQSKSTKEAVAVLKASM